MAEAVLGSIVGEIIANLVPQALNKVGNLWGVTHELKALRDSISTLRAVLDDAQERYYQSRQIQVWLEKLKDAFYDAQDVLEELNIEAIRREFRGQNEMIKEVRTFFSSSNQIAFNLKMSYKIKAVREKLEAINAGRRFHLDERPEKEWRKRQETHSFIREGDFTGRDDDKKMVMKFLLDSDMKEHVSILPIVGIGGLGKTALAQCVYNDEMVRKHFDLKMWVCVSSDFDMKKLVKSIIACVKKNIPTEDTMERLQSELREEIDGKRYFLVLDDLWNAERETWLGLKSFLVGGARGSKILITTRIPLVAKTTSTTLPHLLKGLSESASLDLLMQMACQKEEEIRNPSMLAIGKEIVRKCSGVPLVIRTIGGLLFFKKTTPEWIYFKDKEFSEVSQREDNIMSVLRLSYDHLPSHLKQCFAFCSLFPKNYEIRKQALVNLWVAEGFIQQSDRSQHLEDIAHGYFMDLLWSNFFQDFKKDPVTKAETCKMHDLMHDLAGLVAGTDCWVAWDDTKSIHERTRRVSHDLNFSSRSGPSILCLKASALRTILRPMPKPTYWEMKDREPPREADLRQLIKTSKSLRILDLQVTNVKKVPWSNCKLKHLTYLDLSYNTTLKRLPNSITRLHCLQSLILYSCIALEELPKPINKLVNLRNLDTDFCWKLNHMPCGLGQLRSLHRLTRFILPENEALAKNCCGLEELNGLNNIQGNLCIENLGHVVDAVAESRAANLMGKKFLESVELRWGYLDIGDASAGDRDEALLDGLRPHSNLQNLTIDRYRGDSFPRWMMESFVFFLPSLVELRLRRCARCKHLPRLGQLPHLKSLEILELTELEYVETDYSSTVTESFPSLLRLQIGYCGNLKAMPLTPHLEELKLSKVNPELMRQILGLNKLKSLIISEMEFLECLHEECLQNLTSLEILSIYHCPRLTSLSLGMQHLSNLVNLSLWCCEELDLLKDESDNVLDLQGLKSLRFVEILDAPELVSLPKWLLQISSLEYLSIKKCSNLKALPEQMEVLQSLQRLEIIQCPSLTTLPEGMQRLSSLSHLRIAACPDLEERCKRDVGEEWYKIAHVPHLTHELKYSDKV